MQAAQKQGGAATGYLPPVLLGSFPFIFINFALPIRADELGITAFGIGGMYAVFTGTMLLIRPIVGYCLDRFGRRWFFGSAFLFYALAMWAFARSTDMADFYVARGLQGIGASLMWVSVRTIIADLHDAAARGVAMGRLTTTSVRGSMLGAVYGFTLVGFMPLAAAWVWAFAGYAVVAACGWGVAMLRVGESRAAHVAPSRQPVQWSRPLRRMLVIVFLSAFASALIEPLYLLFLKNKFDLHIYVLALAFLPAGLVFAVLPRYSGQWSDRWGRARLIAAGVTLAGAVSCPSGRCCGGWLHLTCCLPRAGRWRVPRKRRWSQILLRLPRAGGSWARKKPPAVWARP